MSPSDVLLVVNLHWSATVIPAPDNLDATIAALAFTSSFTIVPSAILAELIIPSVMSEAVKTLSAGLEPI